MKILVALLPVVLFLTVLFFMDSFRLVSKWLLMIALLWGFLVAGIAYFLNSWMMEAHGLEYETLTRYIAPVSEEILKSLLIIGFIIKRKVGFTMDAIIYGFAIGAGFALVENTVFIIFLDDTSTLATWLIRGFGTAFMHGGATALLAGILISGIQRERPAGIAYLAGLFVAILLHSSFNHFFLNAFLQAILLFLLLPLLFYAIFTLSTTQLQDWLEIEFSSEIELLRMIRAGKLSGTKSGEFLISLKSHFSPEMIFDLYMYLQLYLELSIQAKRNLMLRENGFDPIPDPQLSAKLTELASLRKQIGKTGELTIQPLIRMKYRDLWKLNQL